MQVVLKEENTTNKCSGEKKGHKLLDDCMIMGYCIYATPRENNALLEIGDSGVCASIRVAKREDEE